MSSHALFQVTMKYAMTKTSVHGNGSEIQSALLEWTGQKTVPNVFIGGNCIGGCDTTTKMHNDGKLVPLLTRAGAVKAEFGWE
ncbi:Glutaredoxin-C2 [Ancistrocladus abbreviatus]